MTILLCITGGTLLFGMFASFSNMANISGLLTGAILGLLFFRNKQKNKKKKSLNINLIRK